MFDYKGSSLNPFPEVNLFPKELGMKIFSYLEPEALDKCRLVCKMWMALINNENSWNDKEEFEIRRARAAYFLNKRNLEAIEAEKGSLAKPFFVPSRQKETWMGYFVFKINYSTGALSNVRNVIGRSFPSVQNELNRQNDLERQNRELVEKDAQLTSESKRLKEESEKLWITSNAAKAKKIGNDNMMRLFGGRASFEKLPVLDIGERMGDTGYIDFINPGEMKAPIMRGRDMNGREFFTLRVQQTLANGRVWEMCQTFFQRYTHLANWSDGGTRFIFPVSHIIDDSGKISEGNLEAYKQLEELIKTGTLTKNTYVIQLV